jgi:hypothetical protein
VTSVVAISSTCCQTAPARPQPGMRWLYKGLSSSCNSNHFAAAPWLPRTWCLGPLRCTSSGPVPGICAQGSGSKSQSKSSGSSNSSTSDSRERELECNKGCDGRSSVSTQSHRSSAVTQVDDNSTNSSWVSELSAPIHIPMQQTEVLTEDVVHQRYLTLYHRRVKFSHVEGAHSSDRLPEVRSSSRTRLHCAVICALYQRPTTVELHSLGPPYIKALFNSQCI